MRFSISRRKLPKVNSHVYGNYRKRSLSHPEFRWSKAGLWCIVAFAVNQNVNGAFYGPTRIKAMLKGEFAVKIHDGRVIEAFSKTITKLTDFPAKLETLGILSHSHSCLPNEFYDFFSPDSKLVYIKSEKVSIEELRQHGALYH